MKIKIILQDNSIKYVDFNFEKTYPIDIFLSLYYPEIKYKSYKLINKTNINGKYVD